MNRGSKASLFLTKFYVNSSIRQLSCAPILYQRHHQNQNKSSRAQTLGSLAAATSLVGGLWYIFKYKNVVYAKELDKAKNEIEIITKTGSRLEGLPQYRKNEVKKLFVFTSFFLEKDGKNFYFFFSSKYFFS